MTRFEHELKKRIDEQVAHLDAMILSGNLPHEVYLQETAKRAAYIRVVDEFFGDATTAMNKE